MKAKIIDPNMAVRQAALPDCVWHSCDESPMVLEGIKFRNRKNFLRRLPVSTPEKPLPSRVDGYADHTTGGVLRFRTGSSFINISAQVRVLNNSADIMTYGRIGFDAYRIVDGHYRYAGITRLNFDEVDFPVHRFQVSLLFETNPSGELREYEINFPLYGQVEEFALGLATDAQIFAPSPRISPSLVAWYGTSVIQGCCASRPGLGLSNRLSRLLNREVINFGFAGSACGEPEVAAAISCIAQPACFILSYDGNVSCERLAETLPGFIDILRQQYDTVPILTISLVRSHTENRTASPDRLWRNAIHMANRERRREAGDRNIFFLDGASMLDTDCGDCYTDECHINDLGMTQYIARLYPELERLLANP